MDSIFSILVIILIGFLNAILLFEVLIPFFKRIKFGQSIREEGPRGHSIKSGTPTMGGIVIIIITLFLSLILMLFNNKDEINISKILLIFIPFIGFGLIGFIDDYLIVVKKNNEGLKPSLKFIMQLIVSLVVYYLILSVRKSNMINFFGFNVDIKFLYGVFIVVAFTGFSNATNLTDGLDGLLGGSSLIVTLGIMLLAIHQQNKIVVYFSVSLFISILSFLCFNLPKAKIFMGDTGSLAIGAALFSMLIMLNRDLLIFIYGFVYLLETISVMLQVWFFKKTKGNRLFKMTPLHHHLELSGLNEIKIDIIFWIFTLIISVFAYFLGVFVF